MDLNKGNIKKIILIRAIAILIFYGINNFDIVLEVLGNGISLCFPFILGCAIAFIINIPMSKIEKLFFKKAKSKKAKKIARPAAIVITLIILIAIIVGAMFIIIPEIGVTIKSIVNQIPAAWDKFIVWLEGTPLNGTFLEKYEKEIENVWNNMSDTVIPILKSGAMGVLNTGIGVVSGVVSGVANFVIAFIFSIYILMQKEKLGSQFKRMMLAFMPSERVEKVISILSLTNSTFASFITGQCLEACILGTMFIIAMTILKIPYALLIGILIAFTALIPIVGAFIGCVVGAFLIVIVSPVKALIFIILFLILQQIEGNLIYPHVVGNSVGLPSIWVLVAVTVGGGIMGITGMIIFIPVFSVAYALIREYVRGKEKEKTAMAALALKNSEGDKGEEGQEDLENKNEEQ